MSYRVLVLPERETMTPALLRKVRELVEAGATVIGPKPRKSPSLSGYPECDAEVKRLADELWGDCDGERVTENVFGKGKVVWVKGSKGDSTAASDRLKTTEDSVAMPNAESGKTWFVGNPPLNEPEQYGDYSIVTGVLEKMAVRPDFSSDVPLRYAHRRDAGTEIYFVSNPEPRVVEGTVVFRVDGLRPELWDAATGEIRELPRFEMNDGRTSVPLRFEPHQSFFVVFRKPVEGRPRAGSNFPSLAEAAVLVGPWEVSFDPKWGGPEKNRLRQTRRLEPSAGAGD